MPDIPHPCAFLPPALLTTIRSHAAEAEEHRQLHEEQLKLIYTERWFKMFLPAKYGGREHTLPQALKIEEALAFADGSTAWVATLCSGAGWFVGFLDPQLSDEIFLDDKVCLAGSGAATGTADVVNGGYIINGEWKYASGSLHATMFTANCRLIKDGVAVSDDEGRPKIMSFIFFREEVSLQENWNSMGIIATASHGFLIKDLVVPANRAFLIDKKHAILINPIYQYPFLQLAEATLVVNLSGMAQQFLDMAKVIFAERTTRYPAGINLMKLYDRSQGVLQACRNEFYRSVEQSWAVCESGGEIPHHILEEVSETSYKLYLACLSEVDTLYRYSGMSAANPKTEINRVWRNIHTASQHSLFCQNILAFSNP